MRAISRGASAGRRRARGRGAGAADQQLRALYEADWVWSMREFAQIDDGEGGVTEGDRLPSVTPAAQRQGRHLLILMPHQDWPQRPRQGAQASTGKTAAGAGGKP